MKRAYQVLAYFIAALVAIQAATIAYTFAGLGRYVDNGGVINKAKLNGDALLFPEEVGLPIHGLSGEFLIPLIALVLLLVSFFAKVRRGRTWAATLLGLIVVQVLLGMFMGSASPLSLLHGVNALAVFAVAVIAGWSGRAARPPVTLESSQGVRQGVV